MKPNCSHNIKTIKVYNGIETGVCMLCKYVAWVVPAAQGVFSYRLVKDD